MEERRSIPRYLCSDDFSDSQVTINSQVFNLISTNFNRNGLALYASERLPEGKSCSVSFSFEYGEGTIQLRDVPSEIRHRHETEVGCQYGIKFLTENSTDDAQFNLLILVEEFLEASSDNTDRYGLE